MKNQWIEFYSGIVSVKVSGKGIERFINKLIRNGITIWNVKRHGTETVFFNVKLRDITQLRMAARNCGCKIRFQQRIGFPFLLKKLLSNSGILIGAALFFITILVLSNMVWGIEIKGANPATEYQIRKEMDKMGIKTGKFQFFIEDVESIQRNLTNQIQVLTWVGVELKGTTYHLQVVEKNTPEQPIQIGPQHLVAKKEAVITKIFVEKGKQLVNINDHVNKGQLLVSGLIGKEGQTEQVSATGEIKGETWYKSYVELPLKSTFQVFNGNEKRKFLVKIGGFSVPIWGFGEPKYKEYEIEGNTHKIHFLYWQLPISYENKTYRERETVTREYTNEEAIKKAKEIAIKDIKTRLSEDATIKGEKILHQAIENGKVKLSLHFQIIENIAQGQPIIQGDDE
jgi:similar to stage IV sporulation protein